MSPSLIFILTNATVPFSERAFAQSIGIAEQNYNALPHAMDDPNVVGAPFTEPERTQWDHLSTTPPERSDSSSCDGRRECRRDGDRAFVGLPSADSRRLPVGLTAVRAFARLAPKKRTSLDSLIVDGVAVLLA